MSFISSSSQSSSKSQHISMPVFSQIMEVKIQGKKLCDMIKELTIKNKELEKINASLKQQKNHLHSSAIMELGENPTALPNDLKKNGFGRPLLRKYSIPVMNPRQKKRSFQTTIVSDKEKTSRQESMRGCTQCEELKSYIIKFNAALKKIQKQNPVKDNRINLMKL